MRRKGFAFDAEGIGREQPARARKGFRCVWIG